MLFISLLSLSSDLLYFLPDGFVKKTLLTFETAYPSVVSIQRNEVFIGDANYSRFPFNNLEDAPLA